MTQPGPAWFSGTPQPRIPEGGGRQFPRGGGRQFPEGRNGQARTVVSGTGIHRGWGSWHGQVPGKRQVVRRGGRCPRGPRGSRCGVWHGTRWRGPGRPAPAPRSEEHTSELQSHVNIVCRLLLEKKKKTHKT